MAPRRKFSGVTQVSTLTGAFEPARKKNKKQKTHTGHCYKENSREMGEEDKKDRDKNLATATCHTGATREGAGNAGWPGRLGGARTSRRGLRAWPARRGGAHEKGRGRREGVAGGRAALAVGGGWSRPRRRHRLGPEARRALSRQSRVAPWSPRAPACWGRADRARGPDRPRRALFLFRFPGLGGGRAGELRSGGGRWVGTARGRPGRAPTLRRRPRRPRHLPRRALEPERLGGGAGVRGSGSALGGRPGRPAATCPVPRSPREWPRLPGRAPAKAAGGLAPPGPAPSSEAEKLPPVACAAPPTLASFRRLGDRALGLGSGLRFPQVCRERTELSPGSKEKQREERRPRLGHKCFAEGHEGLRPES